MSIFEQIELEDKIMKICKSLHERLSLENQDSDESIMTADEVNRLEPVEALKHITEAVKELLSHQRNLKIFKEYQDFHESEIIQTTLQKLEADIREHIKIENQLKLYCESVEESIEENIASIKKLEAGNSQNVEELEKENEELKKEKKRLEEEIEKLKMIKNQDFLKEQEVSKEPEAESQAENEQKTVILLDKFIKVKRLKEQARKKEHLCKELTKQNKEMVDVIKMVEEEKKDIEFPAATYFRIKYKEKCKEIASLKKRLNKKNERKTAKSLTPLINTVRNSASPTSRKRIVHSREKRLPLTRTSKSSNNLCKTLQHPINRL